MKTNVMNPWRHCRTMLLALTLVMTAAAQDKALRPGALLGKERLSATISGAVRQPRLFAPLPVRVQFDWTGTELLTGHLEFRFSDGNERLGRVTTEELTLNAGSQERRFLLPALTVQGFQSSDTVVVSLRFITKKRGLDLGRHTLPVALRDDRALVIAAVTAGPRSNAPTLSAGRKLGLEHYVFRDQGVNPRVLKTEVTAVTAGDVPVGALQYCTYNLMVLSGETLESLNRRQLRALQAWLLGGGACLLIADGAAVAESKLQFLNECLAMADGSSFAINTGDQTMQMPSNVPTRKIARAHVGLGRIAIAPADAFGDADGYETEWRRTVAFLWRLRAAAEASLIATGQWASKERLQELQKAQVQANPYSMVTKAGSTNTDAGLSDVEVSYRYQEATFGANLVNALVPRSVRLVPFHIIVIILVAFVIVVGPIDYWLLGLVGRRRWTWVFFPAMALLFMLITMLVSEHYLGSEDHRTHLTLIDVGAFDRVLRENRFELVFVAREKAMEHKMAAASFAQFDMTQLRDPNNHHTVLPSAASAPPYEGRFPSNYTVRQSVPQWTTQLNRYFSFRSKQKIPAGWADIDPFTVDAEALAEQLRRKGVSLRAVHIFRQGQPSHWYDGGQPHSVATLLPSLTEQRNTGLSAFVALMSPNGGANFEDVAVYDSSDPDAAVVLVVLKDAGLGHWVLRRVHRRASSG